MSAEAQRLKLLLLSPSRSCTSVSRCEDLPQNSAGKCSFRSAASAVQQVAWKGGVRGGGVENGGWLDTGMGWGMGMGTEGSRASGGQESV